MAYLQSSPHEFTETILHYPGFKALLNQVNNQLSVYNDVHLADAKPTEAKGIVEHLRRQSMTTDSQSTPKRDNKGQDRFSGPRI